MTLFIHEICTYTKAIVVGIFENFVDKSCLEQNVCRNPSLEIRSKNVLFAATDVFYVYLFYVETH